MNAFELSWLPEVASDFQASVRALRAAGGWDAATMRRLATSRLNLQQLTSLARALPQADEAMPGQVQRVSILSNATSDLLVPAVAATAARHDLWLRVQAPAFGTYAQEALDQKSTTQQWQPHFAVLALDHRAYDFSPCASNPVEAQVKVDLAIHGLADMVAGLQRSGHTSVVVQTVAPPPGSLFGHLEGQIPGTPGWLIDAFNRQLRATLPAGALLLDVAQVANEVGSRHWHDPALWYLGKFAFSQAAVPLYAEHLSRVMAAARGKSRKCLVLDLDNTLWGGVIGDDGMAGIAIGQGSPLGEAHLAVQQLALALHQRGVVLAVSSKNDDAIARQVFREHPDMLLREEHIAAFQANWQDKASNLQAIARLLNIGVDALVLLDDNPSERQQVRMALPQVGVPELSDSADQFAAILASAGYFETTQFTDEDSQRAAQYQANSARSAMLESSTDLSSHLAALDMEAHFAPFDAVGRPRITQLINKTNQFNLTTRRRTEPEVAALQADPQGLTLQIRLKDRYGDNGMICVVVGQREGHDWCLDTWLMSCRVLNRGLERLVLDVIVAQARRKGVRRLVGAYLPTAKNALVRDHYSGLGFLPADDGDAGQPQLWLLDVDSHMPTPSPIRIAATSPLGVGD